MLPLLKVSRSSSKDLNFKCWRPGLRSSLGSKIGRGGRKVRRRIAMRTKREVGGLGVRMSSTIVIAKKYWRELMIFCHYADSTHLSSHSEVVYSGGFYIFSFFFLGFLSFLGYFSSVISSSRSALRKVILLAPMVSFLSISFRKNIPSTKLTPLPNLTILYDF